MQINTDMHHAPYIQQHKTPEVEGTKVEKEGLKSEQAQAHAKSEVAKTAHVEKADSSLASVKPQKADTVEISAEARKLFEASKKLKDAEQVKDTTVEKQATEKQVTETNEKATKEVPKTAEHLVASAVASEVAPTAVKEVQQTPVKDKESKVDTVEKGAKSK